MSLNNKSLWALLQFREEEDGPFCERLLGAAGSRGWDGQAATRKEDVVLPPEGGWQWTSDWQVQTPWSPPHTVVPYMASAAACYQTVPANGQFGLSF